MKQIHLSIDLAFDSLIRSVLEWCTGVEVHFMHDLTRLSAISQENSFSSRNHINDKIQVERRISISRSE